MKTKVLIIAPVDNSPYALSVMAECLNLPTVEVCGVVVRKITIERFRQEFRRDGFRLIKKVWRKIILRNHDQFTGNAGTLLDRLIKLGVKHRSMKCFAVQAGVFFHLSKDLNDNETIGFFKKCSPNIVLFTGGGLLRQPILDASGAGVLNCHVGVLPRFRGMDVIEWPFLVAPDLPELGMTVHFMDKGVDTGNIVEVIPIEFSGCKSIADIRSSLGVQMVNAMIRAVILFSEGKLSVVKQREEDGKQFFVLHSELHSIAINRAFHFLKNRFK